MCSPVVVFPLLLVVVTTTTTTTCASYQDASLRTVECPMTNPNSPDCIGMYDDQFLAAIKDIIAHMNQSNDQLGLPPLDPLILSDIDLNIDNSIINLNGSLSLEAVGLKELEVSFAHFCLAGLQFFLNMSLPKIEVTGTYSIDGWLGGDLLYVFGDGPWSLAVEGINLYTNVAIKSNTEENHVYVKQLELKLDLGSIVVDIDNLYHDAEISDLITTVLNIALPKLLDIFRQQATCFATEAVAGFLDQMLLNVTMTELICFLFFAGCPSSLPSPIW